MLENILKYNKEFVEKKQYEQYKTSKYPEKELAIVSCMDTRLTELLLAAMGLKNGDVKVIKNAGAVISHPFGSVMRSLIIGVYELGIKEILIVGHTDCGARHTNSSDIIEKMKEKGISQKNIDLVKYCGVDFDSWIGGFCDLEESIKGTVDIVRNHLLMPDGIVVNGLVINSETGEISRVV
ncbi:MAG: beta-class carbonic anhydrase [Lachnospirales bacterium]